MRFSLLALAAVLVGALAAQAGDYRRANVVVVRQFAPTYYAPPVQFAAVDDYCHGDVVPPLQTFRRAVVVDGGYGYGANAFARRQVIVRNQFDYGYGGQVVVQNRGFAGRRARGFGGDGTGAVGIVRAVFGTVGNVARAVVGR